MSANRGPTNRGLLGNGLRMVMRNKRYVVWFYLLNLFLAFLGTLAFMNQAGSILDHSLVSDRLVHGFSVGVLGEMFARPEFGPTSASGSAAMGFAWLFMIATALFLPGVFQGYASTYRLPREDFFRACGRNLWRYIRLMIVAGIVMLVATIAIFGLQGVLERKAAESTNELLLPWVRYGGLFVIFLIMAIPRIWFDLAEADVVLSDQRAVRKSIAAAFRHTFGSLGRLLASYVAATAVAAIILVAGVWIWMRLVAPENIFGALLVSQLTLLFLLIPRFWQRGIAVAYWRQNMLVPLVPMRPTALEVTTPEVNITDPRSAAPTIPIVASPDTAPGALPNRRPRHRAPESRAYAGATEQHAHVLTAR